MRADAGQGSHVLSTLAAADALAAVPEAVEDVPAGAEVDVSWLDAEPIRKPAAAGDATMDRKPQPRTERRRLTHVDRAGRPRMVDVSAKPSRRAGPWPRRVVGLSQETLSLVIDGGNAKGDVLTVAELAGVMGAKRTSELIPLCHPLALTDLVVQVGPGSGRRRPADPRRGRDDRPDRRRDGGPDRRGRRRPDGLRHGQGRRAGRRDPLDPAAVEDRRQERRLGPPGRRAGTAAAPGHRPGDRSAGRIRRKDGA